MTKTILPVLADVEGLGKVVEANTDFYTELQQLKLDRVVLISPRNEAYARIHTQGKENIGKSYGTRTSAGFEYAKEQLPIFRVKSKLNNLRRAKLVVEANRQGNYFHTSSTKEYEDSLKQAEIDKNKEPIKRNVIILPSRTQFTISDKENWGIYQAILKDQAKQYFELNGPIDIYPIDTSDVDSQNGTILTPLWFGSLDSRSELLGYGRSADYYNDRARGVLEGSGEATSPKISERAPYTPRQIKSYSEIVQGVRDGTLPASKLEKIIKFFQGI